MVNFFVQLWACAVFLLGLRCLGFLLGFRGKEALGGLMNKMPVPHIQFYFFSPKPCFCELLWF
jgi:hypothetical protein